MRLVETKATLFYPKFFLKEYLKLLLGVLQEELSKNLRQFFEESLDPKIPAYTTALRRSLGIAAEQVGVDIDPLQPSKNAIKYYGELGVEAHIRDILTNHKSYVQFFDRKLPKVYARIYSDVPYYPRNEYTHYISRTSPWRSFKKGLDLIREHRRSFRVPRIYFKPIKIVVR